MNLLSEFSSVQLWTMRLEKRSTSMDFSRSQTRRAALFWLSKYCVFIKKDPDALILERSKQIQETNPAKKRQHEDYLDSFVVSLKKENYSSNSIAVAQGLICSFYKANHFRLEEIDRVKAHNERSFKVPQVKDLKKMSDLAVKDGDYELNAWLLGQANSGLAIEDLLMLTWDQCSSEFGTIKQQLQKGIVPIHIEIRRQKTSEKTDSFFGPNAVDALKKYVAEEGYGSSGRIFRMSVRSIQGKIKDLAIRSKAASPEFPITPHKLRDFFNTYMKLAGVNESIVERWMGHSIGKVRGAYLVTGKNGISEGIPISVLKETYMDAYPTIDITAIL